MFKRPIFASHFSFASDFQYAFIHQYAFDMNAVDMVLLGEIRSEIEIEM